MAAPTPEDKDANPANPPPAEESKTKPDDSKSQSSYYGYLFETNKSPTRTLDALLRAIAHHITTELGDKDVASLTPKKLAAFYKAVGGDYDHLFLKMPDPAISYIWQVLGCQHTLQPTDNDFEVPSIPALTLRGFVRWESIEILLAPEEHVPFMQFAVRNWGLTNPDTGDKFPVDLPATAFPAEPDEAVDRWHKSCAEKLRREATPKEESRSGSAASAAAHAAAAGATFGLASERNDRSDRSDRVDRVDPRVQTGYAHVRKPPSTSSPRPRQQDGEYFDRPLSYSHVPSRLSRERLAAADLPERYRRGSSPDERSRRKSLSDYPSPPHEKAHPAAASSHVEPSRAAAAAAAAVAPGRRHSHPVAEYPTESDDSDSSLSPRSTRRHRDHSAEGHSHFRRVTAAAPSSPHPPPAAPIAPALRPHRSDSRKDDPRRRSFPIPFEGFKEKFTEKVASVLSANGVVVGSSGTGRPHSASRNHSHNSNSSRRSREDVRPSRLNRSWSDLDSEESDDEGEGPVKEEGRRVKRYRDRGSDRSRDSHHERERERDGHNRDRERVRDRERDRERDRFREHDHEKVYNRSREREHERERDRERERGRDRHSNSNSNSHSDRDRDHVRDRAERDRDRHERDPYREDDRGGSRPRRERERERTAYLQRPERPDVHRRTSSHADVDRRRDQVFDPRERERVGVRGGAGEDRRRWSRGPSPAPMTGVGGRKYAANAAYS